MQRFREWLRFAEEPMVAGSGPESAEDRGLIRQQTMTQQVPDSELARKVFGIKAPAMCRKHQKKR